MRTLNILIVAIIFMLGSCAPQMSAVWQKEAYTPKEFSNVAVIAISKNLEARAGLEQYIIEGLSKENQNSTFIAGLKILPPNLGKESWKKENITQLLANNNVDALIVTSLVNSYISDNYVSGEQLYAPRYYRAGRHIYRTYSSIYTAGYYEKSQNYVLESVIFDLKEGSNAEKALIWKGQSEVNDPSSIASGASDYAKNLVKYLTNNKVLANTNE